MNQHFQTLFIWVEQETIKAVVLAYADGEITHDEKTRPNGMKKPKKGT